MSTFVDLSHVVGNGTKGPRIEFGDGRVMQASMRLEPWITREQQGTIHEGAAFEITEVRFPTIIGTYVDSPHALDPEGRDVARLGLEDLILPGIAIDARGLGAGGRLGPESLPRDVDLEGAAVIVNFGWDRFWLHDDYARHPCVSDRFVDQFIERGACLLGVDTGNVDSYEDLSHPTHHRLLGRDSLIVENLTNLHLLHRRAFRFFALPIRCSGAASMSVRAFAELTD